MKENPWAPSTHWWTPGSFDEHKEKMKTSEKMMNIIKHWKSMNIMDKSLNTMEKTTKKGKPAENQTPFSEMDESNGKMNVTWVKPMENIDENHEEMDEHRGTSTIQKWWTPFETQWKPFRNFRNERFQFPGRKTPSKKHLQMYRFRWISNNSICLFGIDAAP